MTTINSKTSPSLDRLLWAKGLSQMGPILILLGGALLFGAAGLLVYVKLGEVLACVYAFVALGIVVVALHFAIFKTVAWMFTLGLGLVGLGVFYAARATDDVALYSLTAMIMVGAVMLMSGWRNMVLVRPYRDHL